MRFLKSDPAPGAWDWLVGSTAPWWAVPVFALLTAVLTWWLTSRSTRASEAREQRRELRALRLESYTHFMRAVTAARSPRTVVEIGPAVDRVNDGLIRVDLIGSDEAIVAAKKLVDVLRDVGIRRDPEEIRAKVNPLIREFRDAVRGELTP